MTEIGVAITVIFALAFSLIGIALNIVVIVNFISDKKDYSDKVEVQNKQPLSMEAREEIALSHLRDLESEFTDLLFSALNLVDEMGDPDEPNLITSAGHRDMIDLKDRVYRTRTILSTLCVLYRRLHIEDEFFSHFTFEE